MMPSQPDTSRKHSNYKRLKIEMLKVHRSSTIPKEQGWSRFVENSNGGDGEWWLRPSYFIYCPA
jgi:hypothetical protein